MSNGEVADSSMGSEFDQAAQYRELDVTGESNSDITEKDFQRLPTAIQEGLRPSSSAGEAEHRITKVYETAAQRYLIYLDLQERFGFKETDLKLLAASQDPFRLAEMSSQDRLRVAEILDTISDST